MCNSFPRVQLQILASKELLGNLLIDDPLSRAQKLSTSHLHILCGILPSPLRVSVSARRSNGHGRYASEAPSFLSRYSTVSDKFHPVSPEEFAARVEGQPPSEEPITAVVPAYTNGPAYPSKPLQPPEDFYRDHEHIVDGQAAESRLPPFDLEAEAAVLSTLLLQPEELSKVSQQLAPDSFYSEPHRRIFEAVLSLQTKERDIDIVTVGSELKETGRLAQVGGLAYLTQILNSVPAITHIASYAETVRQLAYRRAVILSCQKAAATLFVEGVDLLQVAEGLRATLDLAPSANVVLSTEEIFATLPDIPWLVPALGIAPGAPTMFVGSGWSGKSLIAQTIAIAVASGTTLWNQFTTKQGRVLHLDYEQGNRLTRSRYQKICHGKGLTKDDLGGRLEAFILPPFSLSSSSRESILTRAGEDRDLVIIDSLRASTPGLDENLSEMREPLDAAGRASEKTGCTFLFIHHRNKLSDEADSITGIRGSSAIFEGNDCVFIMKQRKSREDPIVIINKKSRALGLELDPFNLYFDDVDDRTGIVFRYEPIQSEAGGPDPKSLEREAEKARREAVEEARSEKRRAQKTAEKQRQDRDDDRILEIIIRKNPGIGKHQLRAKMATTVPGGCGRFRTDQSVERTLETGLIRVEPAARGELLHHLVAQDEKAKRRGPGDTPDVDAGS